MCDLPWVPMGSWIMKSGAMYCQQSQAKSLCSWSVESGGQVMIETCLRPSFIGAGEKRGESRLARMEGNIFSGGRNVRGRHLSLQRRGVGARGVGSRGVGASECPPGSQHRSGRDPLARLGISPWSILHLFLSRLFPSAIGQSLP